MRILPWPKKLPPTPIREVKEKPLDEMQRAWEAEDTAINARLAQAEKALARYKQKDFGDVLSESFRRQSKS